jgi:hypothetical protein
MPVLSQLYPTYGAALRVLNDLEAAGVPANDIGLVSGEKGAGARTGPGASEANAPAYAEGISRGDTLVSVRADDVRASQVRAILGVQATGPAAAPDATKAGRDGLDVASKVAEPDGARVVPAADPPPAAAGAFQERVIEVRATGEEAVVSKEVRVVEEIVLRKGATDRVEIVRDTARETKVDIEDSTPPR